MHQKQEDFFEKAYEIWCKRFNSHQYVDEFLCPFLKMTLDPDSEDQLLKNSRQALRRTLFQVAVKAGMTESRLSKIEKSEITGNIRLSTMREVAKALDCEFVYVLCPRSGLPFSRIVWNQVIDLVKKSEKLRCSNKKANDIAALAQKIIDHPKMKDKMGWNRRDRVSEGGSMQILNRYEVEMLRIFEPE